MKIYNIFHYAVANIQEKDYKWNSRSNEKSRNKLQKWQGLNKTLNLWKKIQVSQIRVTQWEMYRY